MARGVGMTGLEQLAQEYLQTRRALGYKLTSQGRILAGFIRYLDHFGATRITVEAALGFATGPKEAQPIWWTRRLSVVRGFADYVHAVDPTTEVSWMIAERCAQDFCSGRVQKPLGRAIFTRARLSFIHSASACGDSGSTALITVSQAQLLGGAQDAHCGGVGAPRKWPSVAEVCSTPRWQPDIRRVQCRR